MRETIGLLTGSWSMVPFIVIIWMIPYIVIVQIITSIVVVLCYYGFRARGNDDN